MKHIRFLAAAAVIVMSYTTTAVAQPKVQSGPPPASKALPLQPCGDYFIVDSCANDIGLQVYAKASGKMAYTFSCKSKSQCSAIGRNSIPAVECESVRKQIAAQCPALR